MTTKLYIPVEKLKNDFEITQELSEYDYDRMIDYRTNDEFNRISSYLSGNEYIPNDGLRYNMPNQSMMTYNDLNDEFEECEAHVLNIENQELLDEELESVITNEDMLILILKINPNSLLEDSETELRLWLNQTSIINKNSTLSNDDKLLKLPMRTLKLQRDNTLLTLHDCRIIETYSKKFDFAILIKKITY